jgi:ribonuclease HII
MDTPVIDTPDIETKKKRSKPPPLQMCMHEEPNIIEIGVDEAGRGPLFGRVYAAAVILPKDDSFDHFKMKDSKKFTSKKTNTIEEVAEYIKNNALAWHISYEDEKVIDKINILQATQQAMHKAINETRKKYDAKKYDAKKYDAKKYDVKQYSTKQYDAENQKQDKIHLLIDGNYFNPIIAKNGNKLEALPYTCVEGGDNKFSSIAAASILAKVSRDQYIAELCSVNPELVERYAIDANKGYGAKKHLDGIREHGITIWHRRTFGICKTTFQKVAPKPLETSN